MTSANQRVKDYWSSVDFAADDRNFYCFPPIRARSCFLAFGETDSALDWCESHTAEELRSRLPFEKCLSICCGFGHVERSLWKLGVARGIVGTDIAPGAIDEARRNAVGNIKYYVSDLNRDPIPSNEYDLIWANGALHHLANIEHVVPKLHAALRPNGVLVSTEFVGPRYQQLDKDRVRLVASARQLLPQELKCRSAVYRPYGMSLWARATRYFLRRIDAAIHREPLWIPPPVEHFLATDPSECVSSDQIIPTLKKWFNVDVRGFGGSIVFYALDSAFYNNFDKNNRVHREALEALFAFEDAHLASIGHDNVHLICTKL